MDIRKKRTGSKQLGESQFRSASDTIAAVRRRVDPKSLDLTTECPECHYKVHPSEMMRLDNDHMRCSSCKQDVLVPKKGAHTVTAVPREGKE